MSKRILDAEYDLKDNFLDFLVKSGEIESYEYKAIECLDNDNHQVNYEQVFLTFKSGTTICIYAEQDRQLYSGAVCGVEEKKND